MFSTSSKYFNLFLYAGGLAQAFVVAPLLVLHCHRPYNSTILAFVDVEAKQGKCSMLVLVLVLDHASLLDDTLEMIYLYFECS